MKSVFNKTCGVVAMSLLLALHASLFISCGGESGRFSIAGDFKGFNQGEIYIYGHQGSHKLDTVSVVKGHFEYRIPLEDTITFVIVFPNYSELPVIGVPSSTIEVSGDATHLKEMQVKGTKDNEELTAFRLKTSDMTPPETAKAAEQFIREHPANPACSYVLDRYFVRTAEPDYRLAARLATVISEAAPADKELAGLSRRLSGVTLLKKGDRLPSFTATDIFGKPVSSADLNAKVNVLFVWATWNYESTTIRQQLQRLSDAYGRDLRILSVCIDASARDCRNYLRRDSIRWSTVCDGRMWESPILQKTGLNNLPDNIITDSKGVIIDHTLNYQSLSKKLAELLDDKPSQSPSPPSIR